MSNPRFNDMELAVRRLDWTHTHIEQFDRAVDAFLGTNPYHIIAEREDKGIDRFNRFAIKHRFQVASHPPPELRFLAGDIVHNLRCVVNNVLWSLWKSVGGNHNLSLEFKECAGAFDTSIRERFKLARLPPPIVAWYEGEQIYNRPDGKPSLLNMVNRIWNDDKHKVPVLLGTAMKSSFLPDLSLAWVCRGEWVNLKDGDVVHEAFAKTNKIFQLEPQISFVMDVAFDCGDYPARRFLRTVEDHIRRDVLPKFEPFLS